MALFARDGSQVRLEANNDAVLLILSGEPIDEPIVGHGPFVMNTEAEIHQAFIDFQSENLAGCRCNKPAVVAGAGCDKGRRTLAVPAGLTQSIAAFGSGTVIYGFRLARK